MIEQDSEWIEIETNMPGRKALYSELVLNCDCYEPGHVVLFRYEPKYDDEEKKIHWPSSLRIYARVTWSGVKDRIKKAWRMLLHGTVEAEIDTMIEGDYWIKEMRDFCDKCEKWSK